MGISVILIYLMVASIDSAVPQDAYDTFPEAALPVSGQKILVFVPHPDDETIAIGGYIYECQMAGARIEIVLVSDGNRRGLKDQRYKEFRAAAQQLGLAPSALRYWGYPDSQLALHIDEVKAQAEDEIQAFQPDVLIYPHPADRHPDHAALGRALEGLLAQDYAGNANIHKLAYLVHYKYYPEPTLLSGDKHLLPPAALSRPDEEWEKIALSESAQKAKDQAIHQYNSQLRNPFLTPLFLGLQRPNEIVAARMVPNSP